MNLQQLEYFKAIAETENFTAASKLLSVTQPALSKAIAKLEEELKVPLFEKSGRNIKLSKYGKLFLKHATTALKELENGLIELKKLRDPNSGTISIATTANIGLHFIPSMISSFMIENPLINFQFNYQSTQDILSNLIKKEVDFGFFDCISSVAQYPQIEMLPIHKEEYVLIVPKQHRLANQTEVSLCDLRDEYFVASCTVSEEMLSTYSKLLGYTPKISISPSESTIVEGLVAAGAGIALVSNTPLLSSNLISVIKIKEKISDRTLYMGWNKEVFRSPHINKFSNYMEKSLNR